MCGWQRVLSEQLCRMTHSGIVQSQTDLVADTATRLIQPTDAVTVKSVAHAMGFKGRIRGWDGFRTLIYLINNMPSAAQGLQIGPFTASIVGLGVQRGY